ncbi:hypothetical protein C8C83_4033 [Flavobacterium sp. 90]|nr:hypothetical protein C8C82_4364 [Flavobacterium sp. 81]TCK56023.1 hypothetical protein C8C83_4033 [Flavobacterium sp. 90]
MLNDNRITRVFKLFLGCLFIIFVSWILFLLIDKLDLYHNNFWNCVFYIIYFAVIISFYLGIILFIALIYLLLRKYVLKKA